MKINKSGFSLVELMVVIAIIAIVSSAVLPLLKTKSARYERTAFVTKLNALMRLGWQRSIMNHSMVKILFNFATKTITLEEEVRGKPGQQRLFVPFKKAYITPRLAIPRSLHITQFIINGMDEMSRPERTTKETWFYIMPRGITQPVTIVLAQTNPERKKRSTTHHIELNPFTGQFLEI